ncbi:MAG TPA: 3,4-dihydroxy-2-butanone-4-phosphate synthase, partial [Pyrinomonadaceae bacterium]|nr:3,4-dihydroxy-2-butanone-4-phosphate synthase [Pyrinomonadaceae bacterium]
MPLATIDQAVGDIRAGKMIIIVDDEDRENEGDLVCAAELVTPEIINFMAVHGRGLICMPLTEERCDFLQLNPQTPENTSGFGTAFTVSIEAKEGVTTGISAADRAHTIRTAVDPNSTAADLARPGHVFPLRARRGGVLVAAVELHAGAGHGAERRHEVPVEQHDAPVGRDRAERLEQPLGGRYVGLARQGRHRVQLGGTERRYVRIAPSLALRRGPTR